MRRALADAVGFLTIVPGGRGQPDTSTLLWFGAVGAVLGAVVAASVGVVAGVTSGFVAAVAAVTLDVVLTGALHVDGLADTADGLLPPVDRSRRLAIMATPDVGAFGVVAVLLCVLLRVGVFSLGPSVIVVSACWAVSRSLAAVVVVMAPYARSDGLAAAFVADDRARARVLVVSGSVIILGAAAAGAVDLRGGLGVVAAVGAATGVVWFARRRLGGFTGDVLGAAILLSETVGLLVATST